MEQPKIQFKSLKGFPSVDQKIRTDLFLEAASEIVGVIETFGKIFKPVINDMNGNITKLTKSYNIDREKFRYLEDLIILNIDVDKNYAATALLWLKRGLQLICMFFENIYNDKESTEALKQHLQNAYENTLKPYHGFIVQSTIRIIYNWVPTRSQLIGIGVAHDENMIILSNYLPPMRTHLNNIDTLLKQYELDIPI